MNKRTWAALIGLLVVVCGPPVQADPDPELAAQMKSFLPNIQARINAGQRDERAYSDLLQQADALVDKHINLKTDQVSDILYLESRIYVEVATNADRFDKAIALLQRAAKDFPQTRLGRNAPQILGILQQKATQERIWQTLTPGSVFPDFNVADFDGKPLSVAAHKGHLVLIDFWATWCVPCQAEFPNIKKTYEAYHDKGLDVVGISLDDDREKLAAFIKANGVTWPQSFQTEKGENILGLKYGIPGIPANILVDADGKIIDKDLHGPALQQAVAKALAGHGA